MYAGSNEKARKVSANASLLAFVIEDAHKKGLKLFDLMGVSPKDEPSHRWAGFSKFKRSFGGYEVPFNGTYEKPIRQFRYKIMTNLRKLSKK
jgi:lipid II:glycine glycyltransferase (peptidoglycan interpeptide bridge formation enzyme)